MLLSYYKVYLFLLEAFMRHCFYFIFSILSIIGCADISNFDDSIYSVEKIVGGTSYSGHPSVVRVVSNLGTCTGTVIHPKVVITAKHCIEDNSVEDVSIEDIQQQELARTIHIITTSSSYFGAHHKDFASLILDQALPITPVPWVRRRPNIDLGTKVLAVGYGMTDVFEGGAGEKRKGYARVTGIYEKDFATTPIGCYGDSGGPIFLPDGRVWGVLAYFEFTGAPDERAPGNLANCRVVNSLYARTDIHASDIQHAIQIAEGNLALGEVETPQNFKATLNNQRVVLTWEKPIEPVQHFELQREKKENGRWTNHSVIQINKAKRRLRFRVSSGLYRFRLRAVGEEGVSDWTSWRKLRL